MSLPSLPASGAPGYPSGRGFGLRAIALTYLAVMLLIPLAVILADGLSEGLSGLWYQVSLPQARHALLLTLWTSAVMTAINMVMGTLTAYVLVRYEFPGKNLLNSLVDLPLAIPTLVTGVMLVVLYGPQGALGGWLESQLNFPVIFAPPGIILALLFITFPFMVRAVQPVLAGLDRTQEDAATTLGASAWTIFRRITLPPLALPIATGALLSFARAIGEFGAIVIVAGNIPMYSQTAAVYVLGEVESENRLGASAVSVVMLAIALAIILLVDWMQRRSKQVRA
ncbi:MAG: sulfate ABC transporter permease subunit CysT [Chloroflexi bacterium]|jgi:sulfate transport system permease protein|nr:sulfate ABC transporter permease subunit CysT [Anaerolineaceae bacterium]NMB89483.1 sulfate ABC transporter permease subunit CysT [Chloroflexota bacterium]